MGLLANAELLQIDALKAKCLEAMREVIKKGDAKEIFSQRFFDARFVPADFVLDHLKMVFLKSKLKLEVS